MPENGTWIQDSVLPQVSNNNDYSGFGYSVEIKDTFAFVGAIGSNLKTFNAGAVYVYKKNNNSWEYNDVLLPNESNIYDHFGATLSFKGNTLAIGSYYKAYFFSYVNNKWSMVNNINNAFNVNQKIRPNYLRFSGEYTIIPTNSKSICIYQKENDKWQQFQYIEPSVSNYFGYNLSIFDNTLFVGIRGDSHNGINSGSVYIYNVKADNNTSNITNNISNDQKINLKDAIYLLKILSN